MKVLLVNFCEDACEYGPASSEYLRAQFLATPDLHGRAEIDILFVERRTPAEIAEMILSASPAPDLVGFTCFSWNIRENGDVCRELRRRGADFPIVWGGCSFALFRERNDWFRWWDCVDAVAVGSGEYTLAALARYLIDRPRPLRIEHALPGLVVNCAGTLDVGGPAPGPRHLDDFASPYLRGVRYRVRQPFIEMARGCKFECTFCSDAKSSREGTWRVHSPGRIASEIAEVCRWPGTTILDAGSSTANINDAEFQTLCDAIRAGDPQRKLSYGFQMYPALARPIQRQALEGIRVDKLCFGVQSYTPQTWGPIKRKTTMAHMTRAMDTFGGVGTLQASLLLGLPGETLESFKHTFREVRDQGWVVCVNRLLVLTGTQLHQTHEQHGLRFDESLYYRVTSTPTMNEIDLARAQEFVENEVAKVTDEEWRRSGSTPPIMWTNFDTQRTMFQPANFRRSD